MRHSLLLLALASLAAAADAAWRARPQLPSFLRPTFSRRGKMRLALTERSALLDLFNATNGRGWHNSANWGEGDPCHDRWFGVACTTDPATGRPTVFAINLFQNNLSGRLSSFADDRRQRAVTNGKYLALFAINQRQVPADVTNDYLRPYLVEPTPTALPNLRILDLRRNSLHGEIPVAIGSMTELSKLLLSRNMLEGPIPRSFGNLQNLRILEINNNRLTSIPPLSLKHLFALDLTRNRITTPLDDWLGDMRQLRLLRVGANRITGDIPESICELGKLEFLALNKNKLHGPIPDCIGRLGKLETLQLSRNRLTGSLPDSIAEMGNLEYADFAHNELEGPLPIGLLTLPRLGRWSLLLNGNSFDRPSALFRQMYPAAF